MAHVPPAAAAEPSVLITRLVIIFMYVCVANELLKGKYLEEYMVLNMKMGNGEVGRIEN